MARKKGKGAAAPAKGAAPTFKGAAPAAVVESAAASGLLRYMPHTAVADPSALMPHHFLVKGAAMLSTSQVEPAKGAAPTAAPQGEAQGEASTLSTLVALSSAFDALAKERAATVPQSPAKAPLPPACPSTVAAQKAEPKPEPRSAEPPPTARPASSSSASSRPLLCDLMPHTAVADPAKLMPHHFLARHATAGADAGADAADVDVVMDVEPPASAAAPAPAVAPVVADTIGAAVAVEEARPSAVVQGAEAAVPIAPKQASNGSTSNGSTSSTWLNVRLLAQRLRSALSCA